MDRRGKIVAIVNQKGGVGKTTLAVHLGRYLAIRKRSVIMVDCDPQGNLTTWVLGHQPEICGLAGLLIAHLAPAQVCVPVQGWGLQLVPGYWETGNVLEYVSKSTIPFDRVAREMRRLAVEADYVLLDIAPSRSTALLHFLFAADLLLIPTELEIKSVEGVRLMAQAAGELEGHGRVPRLAGIVPNKGRPTNEHKHWLDVLRGRFPELIYPVIPLATCVTEACSRGMTLFSRDYIREAATRKMAGVCALFQTNVEVSDATVGR